MANLFEQNRNYVLGDEELDLIGDRDKLAQWRHKGMGPAFYKLGRKIVYRGADLNAWAEANRVDPSINSKTHELETSALALQIDSEHPQGHTDLSDNRDNCTMSSVGTYDQES
jgi:hypothetical protein